MKVDAIVNAASKDLRGGGGVDGAIHRAAGPKLLEECRELDGCETGDAKMTGAGRLPAKYVIHTVGPVWHGGTHGEKEDLASCYRRSLELADEAGCESIAFPLISSGTFGYPREEALRVAEETIRKYLADHDSNMDVTLVIFDSKTTRAVAAKYKDLKQYIDDRYTGPAERLARSRRSVLEAPRRTSRVPRAPALTKSDIERPAMGLSPHRAYGAPMGALFDLDRMLKEKQDETFSQRLLRLIEERGMKDAECYRRANVDRRLFSKIRSNPDYHPRKGTAIAFAVALQLTLDETNDLLQSAGYVLTHAERVDIIVEYFIVNKVYDVLKLNEALFAYDQPTLNAC